MLERGIEYNFRVILRPACGQDFVSLETASLRSAMRLSIVLSSKGGMPAMSQIMDALDDVKSSESDPAPIPADIQITHDPTYGQFDYVPMPVVAPVSAVLGLCALLAYFGLFGIILAVIGTVVSLVACWKIGRSKGAFAGMKFAIIGLLLCSTSAIGGSARQFYLYEHEVPEGYERVSFSRDISQKGFVTEEGIQDVHPDVMALMGKPIFLKGFMYPTQQQFDITEFLMLKDSGQCCFGGQPDLQDMINVLIPEGIEYSPHRVAVAGKLKINPNYQGGNLEALFVFEADHFSEAQTSF